MNIRDVVIGAGLALGVVALAQTVQRTLNVVVAGKPATGKAIVVQNETYVSLKALSGLGIKGTASGNILTLSATTQGGANQIGAVEGCIGQDLFNGMLRLKILGISRLETIPEWTERKGWAFQIEAKNGTSERLSVGDMGVIMASIVRANGSIMAADGTGIEIRDWDKLRYTDLLPGSSVNHIIKFIDNDSAPDALPTKLLISVDTTRVKPKINAKFNVKDPSFRVDLTCKK
jgi:hypothetical protein